VIVNTGKTVLVNVFSGQGGRIADRIAVGTGTTPVALSDTALATEAFRVPLTSISADTANQRIVFKGVVTPGVVTNPVTEVGIFLGDILVARMVLATPKTLDPSIPTEVEYSLGLTL
jgi:hypothetical protein